MVQYYPQNIFNIKLLLTYGSLCLYDMAIRNFIKIKDNIKCHSIKSYASLPCILLHVHIDEIPALRLIHLATSLLCQCLFLPTYVIHIILYVATVCFNCPVILVVFLQLFMPIGNTTVGEGHTFTVTLKQWVILHL